MLTGIELAQSAENGEWNEVLVLRAECALQCVSGVERGNKDWNERRRNCLVHGRSPPLRQGFTAL
jgi:hypothetical protein